MSELPTATPVETLCIVLSLALVVAVGSSVLSTYRRRSDANRRLRSTESAALEDLRAYLRSHSTGFKVASIGITKRNRAGIGLLGRARRIAVYVMTEGREPLTEIGVASRVANMVSRLIVEWARVTRCWSDALDPCVEFGITSVGRGYGLATATLAGVTR